MPREDKEDFYPGDDNYDSEEDDYDDDVQDGIDWSGKVPTWYLKACKENISDLNQAKSDDTGRPDHVARSEQMSSHMPAKEAWAYYAKLLEQQCGTLSSKAHVRAFTEHISQSFLSHWRHITVIGD